MNYHRLCVIVIFALSLTAGAGSLGNGTFKFLTEELPEGTTNAEYSSRFVTVNADGAVTFTALSALPAGLSLDPLSGFLRGIPTATFNNDITIRADDGTQQIQFDIALKINAAGGGGNSGAAFVNESLATGRIGTVYSDTLTITNGAGPFTFGAKDLPPGISLNGQTGVLSGNPSAAGRYYVTFSAFDDGEANNSSTVLPLLVLPENSDFQFLTQSLNNGEVGTLFQDTYLVTNAVGTVSFGASGLPPGLTLDPATGVVTGTPTTAGTFEVFISATDGQDTIVSNLGMLITPSSTSTFYWNVFSLPPGLLDVAYDRQPPITVATVNGVDVSYSATGLPTGIAYNATTGELTGTPTEVGEFNTVFTATDASTDEVLILEFRFVILPATGGDINSVPVNFWLSKQTLKVGADGSESWAGSLLFNVDRRTGMGFDPVTDELSLELGSRTMLFPSNSLVGTTSSLSFTSPSGEVPSESVKLSLTKQSLAWSTRSDTLAATAPGIHNVVLRIGSRSYRTAVRFDEKGKATAISAVRPCFVLTKGSLSVGSIDADSATLGLLLADASFLYETGDMLRIRLLEGETVLVDRDFTALGVGVSKQDKSGAFVFTVTTLADTEVTNAIKKLSYSSAKGKLSLALSGLTLGDISDGETHVSIELTIGDRVYSTGVTFFGGNPGTYTTTMP